MNLIGAFGVFVIVFSAFILYMVISRRHESFVKAAKTYIWEPTEKLDENSSALHKYVQDNIQSRQISDTTYMSGQLDKLRDEMYGV